MEPSKTLIQAKKAFQRWRERKTLGERIPQALWDLAIESSKKDGFARTTKALGLNFYDFKKAIANKETSHKQAQEPKQGVKKKSTINKAKDSFRSLSAPSNLMSVTKIIPVDVSSSIEIVSPEGWILKIPWSSSDESRDFISSLFSSIKGTEKEKT